MNKEQFNIIFNNYCNNLLDMSKKCVVIEIEFKAMLRNGEITTGSTLYKYQAIPLNSIKKTEIKVIDIYLN